MPLPCNELPCNVLNGAPLRTLHSPLHRNSFFFGIEKFFICFTSDSLSWGEFKRMNSVVNYRQIASIIIHSHLKKTCLLCYNGTETFILSFFHMNNHLVNLSRPNTRSRSMFAQSSRRNRWGYRQNSSRNHFMQSNEK